MEFVFVVELEALRKQKMVKKDLSSKRVVVVVYNHLDDKIYAVDNLCPHKEASLHRGDIEDLGEYVSKKIGDGSAASRLCLQCPKHRRKFNGGLYFNVVTGRSYVEGSCSKYNKNWKLDVYATKVENGQVFVSRYPVDNSTSNQETLIPNAVSNSKWHQWKLHHVQKYNHNTNIYRFIPLERSIIQVQNPNMWSWHLALRLVLNDRSLSVEREYTPISPLCHLLDGTYVDILIKLYPDGALTSQLARFEPGNVVHISDPRQTLNVPTLSDKEKSPTIMDSILTFLPSIKPKRREFHVALICGGSGIAPIFQLLNSMTQPDSNNPYIDHGLVPIAWVIFSNTSESDILLRKELEHIQQHSTNINVHFIISSGEPPVGWNGGVGKISLNSLKRLPITDIKDGGKVVISGPAGFNSHVSNLCYELGISNDNVMVLEA